MGEKWENVKKTLKEPATKESMKRASEEFKKWEAEKRASGRRSKPVLCNLGYKRSYPSSVPLDKVADQIATNPEFYELMGKVVARGGE